MNFIKYSTFIQDCKEFIETLPLFKQVSFIPRSGMIPAFIYSKRFNVPIVDLKDANKDTIIFEDSVRSGRTLNKIQKSLLEPSYAAVYYVGEWALEHKLDYKYKFIPCPRIFEWNWICQENLINHSCFDLDEVLCHFPIEELKSGKINYPDYLQTAKPKYVPEYEIGCICTARLESDRESTENWLKKNNVKYRKLVMLNCTKEERIQRTLHTSKKIEEYNKGSYVLFVEDEPAQTRLISNYTRKPVLCVTDWEIY